MLDAALIWFGIDARQWRALVGVSYKILLRKRSAVSMQSRSALQGLWLGLLMYGAMGLMFAVIALQATSPGVASFFLLSFILIFIAMLVVLEFGSTIVAPEDMHVLGSRPVTSRTYFAARMTTLLVVVLLYAAALGGPAIVTFGIRFGIASSVGWMIAVLGGAWSTALLMVLVYTTALRHVPAASLRKVMGYFQLILSFAVYGGYIVMTGKVQAVLASAEPAKWMTLVPTSWFAAVVSLAWGQWTVSNLVGCLLAAFTVAILSWLVIGRISLSYAESAVNATTASASSPAGSRPLRRPFGFLRRPEDRAIALLVLRQFRYDVKFKMSILAILPLTILYLYIGLEKGRGIPDPFAGGVQAGDYSSSTLLYVAMILFPAILKNEIIRNDMYESAWVFFAAPVSRGEVILSVKRMLLSAFVLPYLAVLSLVFLWYIGNPIHVFLHLLVLALSCNIFLQVLFLFRPALPFSLPRTVGDRNTTTLAVMIGGPLLFLVIIGLFVSLLYPSPATYAAGVGALVLLSYLLERRLRKRVTVAGEALEFAG